MQNLLDDVPVEVDAAGVDASWVDDPMVTLPLPAVVSADEPQLQTWLVQIVRQDEKALTHM